MQILSMLFYVFLGVLGIYILFSILSSFMCFLALNRAGMILCKRRPYIYNTSDIKEFCERPILLQIFPECVSAGIIPIVHIKNVKNFCFHNDEVVVDIVNDIIRVWLETATVKDFVIAFKELEELREITGDKMDDKIDDKMDDNDFLDDYYDGFYDDI